MIFKAVSNTKWCGVLVAKSCLTLVTLWTVACQTALSMGFPKQDYWSGLPFLSPGDLLEPGIAPPTSPTLAGRFFTAEPPGQPVIYKYLYIIVFIFDSVQFS